LVWKHYIFSTVFKSNCIVKVFLIDFLLNFFFPHEMNSFIYSLLNGIYSFNIFLLVYSILDMAYKQVLKWAKVASHFGFIDDYWLTVYCLWKIIQETWTFMITLLNRKKNFKSVVSNWRCYIWRRKITWFGYSFQTKLYMFKK
jgi:hypothetical protein